MILIYLHELEIKHHFDDSVKQKTDFFRKSNINVATMVPIDAFKSVVFVLNVA